MCVFLGSCVLPANDQCFRDPLPCFYPCPFFLPLTSLILCLSLLFLPPLVSSSPLRCRFNQLALSTADTLSMQNEFPPTLRLSHFLAVFLFSLAFRNYVVMRVSCLSSETFLTLLSLSLVLSLSHAVPSFCRPPVSLIRSVCGCVCGPEMTCVLM